jgi:hypothetical protein
MNLYYYPTAQDIKLCRSNQLCDDGILGVHLIFFASKLFSWECGMGYFSTSPLPNTNICTYVYLVYLVLVGIIYLTYVFQFSYDLFGGQNIFLK